MKKYIGTKEVLAIPMTFGEYNNYRGWGKPDNHSKADGYLAECLDGEPNDERHKGCIEWYTKNEFEKTYKIAETPLDRMQVEYDELMQKHNKLVLFLGREDAISIAGEAQVRLMKRQKIQMHDYLLTLKERMDLMK